MNNVDDHNTETTEKDDHRPNETEPKQGYHDNDAFKNCTGPIQTFVGVVDGLVVSCYAPNGVAMGLTPTPASFLVTSFAQENKSLCNLGACTL